MRELLIEKAKFSSNRQKDQTTPAKIEEETIDSKDDHVSRNLGNVSNVIAKAIEA